jgi:hypothetical protein
MAGQAGATAPSGLRLLAGGLGGPGNLDAVGAAARFNGPAGVASDGAGNCYVADSSNHTIRKVVVATGAVTTLAGSSRTSGTIDGIGAAASFYTPTGLAADGSDSLYVADTSVGAIRKVAMATGAVSTIATTVTQGQTNWPYSNAQPCAVLGDGAGGLYIVSVWLDDVGNDYYLSRVVVASGAATQLATWFSVAPSPLLNTIAADGAGNVYLGDDTSAILKVSGTSGAVTTLAGTSSQFGGAGGSDASAGLARPGNTVTDGAGNLYVADNNTIWKVATATGAATTLAGVGLSNGMASDGAGNLCVSGANNVQKVVIATGAVTTLAGTASHPGSTDGAGAVARFNSPRGIASDGAGNLFIADTLSGTIRKVVVATGAVTTLAGTAGANFTSDGIGAFGTFNWPVAVASDGAGNLYVSDALVIRKVVVATGAVTTLTAGPGPGPGEAGPGGITSDGAGNIYFANAGTTIWQASTANAALTAIAGSANQPGSADGIGSSARFSAVSGIASDGGGNLYVADAGNSTIRKIVLATGAVTTLAGAPGQPGTVDSAGSAARFNSLRGIAYDGTGNLYVADGNTVRKVVIATATVSTVIGAPARVGVSPGPLPASLNDVSGVAVLPTGEIAVIDDQENAVLIARF